LIFLIEFVFVGNIFFTKCELTEGLQVLQRQILQGIFDKLAAKEQLVGVLTRARDGHDRTQGKLENDKSKLQKALEAKDRPSADFTIVTASKFE
jgi:hypothetical protein